MHFAVDDTIAAVASPPGGAVRGVIRVSGPGTLPCLDACFRAAAGPPLDSLRAPTRLRGHLLLAAPIGPLPCHLYLWPTRRSYTRQPSAELHTLGSPPLLDAAMTRLCQCGARLAQPGEFTLRAFLAGRLDLTQAEAVLAVIDAHDPGELQTALAQLAGGLSGPLQTLRSALLELLAHLEAGLDFADEDIECVTQAEIDASLDEASAQLDRLLTQLASRSNAGAEPTVVLRGRPNAGKSSLLNALLAHDAAIVSPQAGTTRDYVSRPFYWQHVSGMLIDTPGWVEHVAHDALTQAAQQAAAEQARQAQLTILCLDATQPLVDWERAILESAALANVLVVWTKADLVAARTHGVADAVYTSSHTGEGIDAVRLLIARRASEHPGAAGAAVTATALRCRQSLQSAGTRLHAARRLAAERAGDELVAFELREALDELGQVVGTVYTDDILDRIFSRFCIGK
ncbi:MAG: GTP-binding protein [Planctomycetaceae bacterium]|mgnify:CR=1 FL=1|nr:GTP-binding protein [Planctomycetaceae bacterium]